MNALSQGAPPLCGGPLPKSYRECPGVRARVSFWLAVFSTLAIERALASTLPMPPPEFRDGLKPMIENSLTFSRSKARSQRMSPSPWQRGGPNQAIEPTENGAYAEISMHMNFIRYSRRGSSYSRYANPLMHKVNTAKIAEARMVLTPK